MLCGLYQCHSPGESKSAIVVSFNYRPFFVVELCLTAATSMALPAPSVSPNHRRMTNGMSRSCRHALPTSQADQPGLLKK